jgi:hypothetical protein
MSKRGEKVFSAKRRTGGHGTNRVAFARLARQAPPKGAPRPPATAPGPGQQRVCPGISAYQGPV